MSINRNLATFAKDVQSDGTLQDSSVRGIAVTVTVSGGKFVIDGTSQQTMFLPKGVKYRLDVSDSSVSGHPLRFSTTSDGTHGGGSQFTTGITTSGTAGSSGAYVEVQLQQDAPDQLFYYCGSHSNMGAGAETAPVTSYGNSDVDSHLNQSNPTSGYVLSWNGSDYAWIDNSGYTDSDVNTHLNVSGASSSQILSWNGSDYAWVDDQSGSGGIASVAADSTPQLGGSLDVNGNAIVSESNGNIAITPNGSGKVIIDGLSYPQADGNADEVLKTDGAGNLSFVAQSSGAAGGSLTATASGALADGSLVAINADGTVSVIKAAVSQSIGTAARYDAGTATDANGNALFGKAAYDTNSNKVVVAYKNNSSSGHGFAVVGTVSGSSISWGTPVSFRGAGVDHMAISFDSSANKFLIVYRDYGNSYYGYGVVGTVSGTSISFGSATQFEAGLIQYVDVAFDSNANKHLVVYQDYHDNTYGKAVVGTISGTSVSFGSPTTYVTSEANFNTVSYDSNAQKFLVCWCRATAAAEAAVGTISGTSVSFGSTATIASGYYQWMSSAFDSGANKNIVAYASTGSPYNGNVKVGTISGTSVSFGSAAVVDTNTDSLYYFALSYNAASNKTLFVYNKGGNSGSGYYNIGTVSGTSISFGTSAVFEDGHVVSGNDVIYDPDSEKNILIFSDHDDYNRGKYIVFAQAVAGGATLTAENFIGISDGAYADSATATIQTAGAVDDAQSGLTAGQTYYVQAATGALGLSPDTISVVAGTAISATKLLINPDSDPTVTAYTDADVNTHLNVSSASANQKLSWNGSDYAWTDDATGAGSITATASGALANGDMVVLNSDGTVSVVADSTQTFSAGTPAVAYSSNISGDPTAVYHSGANKIVAVYRDSSSNVTYAILGTVSGTSITFSNQVTFESSNTIDYLASAYDSNAQAVVVCYRKQGSPFYFGAKAMTVSGTTITVGSERNLLSQQVGMCDVVFDSNVNRLVFAALDFDNSYALKSVVGTVSGTTISSGSATTIHSATYNHKMAYDSGSNKVVIVYRDNANSLYGAARVLTVSNSGNSLSVGSATYFNSARSDNPRVAYDANANKSIVLYTDFGNSSYQTMNVGTVSGTSISFGSAITGFADADFSYRDVLYDPDNQNIALIMHRNSGGLDDTAYFPVTISGTSATVGAASAVLGASDGMESYGRRYLTYDTTANKFVLFFRNYDDNQAQGVVFQTPFDGSTNLTDENFLGVSDGGYSNGATATIQTAGAVDDAQSSLTPAQTYFVQSTGGIGLTPSSPSVVAGTAISATQLLVKSGQPIEKPNTTPLVASGALSDGTKVCINSDGTVSAITETVVSGAVGSLTNYTSDSIGEGKSVYDANSGKVVVAYRSQASGYYGYAVVGTVSGTSISFGTPVKFSGSYESSSIRIAYDSTTYKVLIAHMSDNSSRGEMLVGTVSGTSISFGSPVAFKDGSGNIDQISMAYDTSNQKVVVFYRDAGSSSHGKCNVGTVSGTSVSFGSEVTFNSGETYETAAAFDSTNNKVIIGYKDGGNSDYGTAKVGTISGTTISFGSATVFNSSNTRRLAMAYDTQNQKMAFIYKDQGNSLGEGIVGTVSGTGISFGTAVTFLSGNPGDIGVAYDANAQKMFIAYDKPSTYHMGTNLGTISGTSISFGTEVERTSSDFYYSSTVYDSTNGVIVVSGGHNTTIGKSIVIKNAYTDRNLTASNYVGISDAAYTNGQTATIQVAGATDDAQSGLTAGQLYYVQNNGTLSTTADSPSVIAGTAISATKLIVKG